ncbi:lysophospholipid acyltransferase family protein [Algivirga pacifica]|uniref:Lysophospholipid acyltransferase family protein n=2 Tax=Algivirga pacifica TaxID=1162670 RepID=A0ABP9D1E1_9BACT
MNVHEEVDLEQVKRSVALAAPHTTNWDLVFAVEGCRQVGVKLRFAIKREWMRFPLNIAIRPMGGIGIDRRPKDGRTKKLSMVEAMANLFKTRDELVVMVPPEGTRSKVEQWRTGFYYTALEAGVPITLCYLDFKHKVAGIGKVLHPTGDVEKDMREIMDFYKQYGQYPKFPEMFSLDQRYI